MSRACNTLEEKKNAYMILMGKLEWNRLQGRARRGWVDNIKIDLRKIGRGGMDSSHLAQDRDQWNVLVNMELTSGFMICWDILE
jgi:hypothetical protein